MNGTGDQIFADCGSPTVRYCDVEGGWPGTANIDQDPLFVNAPDDLRLTWLSPCINRGTNEDAPAFDLDGVPRPQAGTVDMGAYEYTGAFALDADKYGLSILSPGSVDFDLFADASNGGRHYLMLGSVTGSAPGILMPGGQAILPVNWDHFTNLVIVSLNTPVFKFFMGTLAPEGSAAASFNVPAPVPQAAGITMSYAYALNNPWDFVSNPIDVAFDP